MADVLTALSPPLRSTARSIANAVAPVARSISPAGRAVLATMVLSFAASVRLGWLEANVLAIGCATALAAASVMSIGRARAHATIALRADRITAGEAPSGDVIVSNPYGRTSHRVKLELEVSEGPPLDAFDVPPVAARDSVQLPFSGEPARRGLLRLGPLRIVRGDPIGLLKREVVVAAAEVVHVHPVTIPLPLVAAGWRRDLEGSPTSDRSSSDLAFHALRDYERGDDLRHVDWRATAGRSDGRLTVREYLDTRKSETAVVLSTNAAEYADADEFELAASIAGSFGRSGYAIGQVVQLVSDGRRRRPSSGAQFLDALAEVELSQTAPTLRALVARGAPHLAGLTFVVVVSGTAVDGEYLRSCLERVGGDVPALLLRAGGDGELSARRSGSVVFGDVSELSQLKQLVWMVRR